jgi:hypothetical protein
MTVFRHQAAQARPGRIRGKAFFGFSRLGPGADGEAAGEFNLLTLVLPCSQKLGQIFLYKNFYRRDVYALKLDYCCGGLIRRQTGGTMSLFLAMPILAATGLYNPQVTDRHHHCMAEAGSIQALYCPAPATPAAPAHHPRHAKR